MYVYFLQKKILSVITLLTASLITLLAPPANTCCLPRASLKPSDPKQKLSHSTLFSSCQVLCKTKEFFLFVIFFLFSVQRVPRYLLMLQSMLRKIPSSDSAHQAMFQAVELLQQCAAGINQVVLFVVFFPFIFNGVYARECKKLKTQASWLLVWRVSVTFRALQCANSFLKIWCKSAPKARCWFC
jgi:hypothetical protein